MTTKDFVKKEIDQLPENLVIEVDRFIKSLTRNRRDRKPLPTLKLGGQFDHVNIREQAYE
ncbi:MAG: hypothetical protein M3Y82_14500 [Verrucomicrobiota bacterium]|nr:hypothetical protein [Verrucomicrobiota bacterium]